MAKIEGTGIKTPSKDSQRMAMATYRVDPMDKVLRDIDKAFKNLSNQESTGAVKETGRGMGDRFNPFTDRVDASDQIKKTNFFSPGGGAYDPRNNVETASADIQSLSVPGSEAFNQEVDQYERNMQKTTTSDQFGEKGTDERQKNVDDSYQIYRQFRYENDPGGYIQGQDFSKAPTKEKTIGERVADFTGNVVNTLTGTQSAVAQTKEAGKGLFGGSVPEGTYSQFSPETKPKYQTNREENRPFSSKNLDASKTPFGSVNLRASEKPTTVKTESKVGGTVVTPADTSALNVKSFGNRGKIDTGDTSFSAYVRGGGEGQERGITTPQSTGAPRQTVASLPSNYKQTEAESFRKAAAFKEAQGIAKRNPNVSVGVDSKGQPKATATNNTGVARAQAMAVNRKLSGTKPKSGKERAQDAAKARKKAGPNRKMSDGQQTRSQAGASARTAQGNRARVRSNARKRAQAAAKRRRKKKSKKK